MTVLQSFRLFVVILLLQGLQTLLPPFSDTDISAVDEAQRKLSIKQSIGAVHHHTRTSFRHKYVFHNGNIDSTKPQGTPVVTISASTRVSELAFSKAATTISLFVRHMPDDIFSSLAEKLGVGIFTRNESMTVFPENAKYADTPACKGRCDGDCNHTCLFDGRKLSTLPGVNNHERALVVEDNVLCNEHDPYFHTTNILVHEFGHLVMDSCPTDIVDKIKEAYNYTKTHHVWRNSYATANANEYWGEATSSFFDTLKTDDAGGMNTCTINRFCKSEAETRRWIKQKDPRLFDLLNHVYTNGQWNIPSGLRPCI